MTICKNCVHFRHEVINPAAPTVWYNFRCGAVLLESKIDPVTGEKPKPEFEHCRNINHGNCELYQERQTVAAGVVQEDKIATDPEEFPTEL